MSESTPTDRSRDEQRQQDTRDARDDRQTSRDSHDATGDERRPRSAHDDATNGGNARGSDSDSGDGPRSEARREFRQQSQTQHEIMEQLLADDDRDVSEERFVETPYGLLRYRVHPISKDWLSDLRSAAPSGTSELWEAYAENYEAEHGEAPDREETDEADLQAFLQSEECEIDRSDLQLDGEGRRVFEDAAVESLESAPAEDDPMGPLPKEDTRTVVEKMGEIQLNDVIGRVIEVSEAGDEITGFR